MQGLRQIKIIIKCLSVAVCLLMSISAHAVSWKPELIPSAGKLRTPADPIKVKIVAPAETIQRLGLELDGFDVTQIVSFDGSVATVIPPQPLAFGEHQLRLIEYQTDGSTTIRGAWTLSIRKSSAFSKAELEGKVWLDVSARVADRDLTAPEPDKLNLGGGTQIQGKIANGKWQISGNSDLIYNKNESLMPRGANGGKADLGHFLVTAQDGPVVAQVGHFNASPEDNLVMQGFSRRGVSLGVNWADNRDNVTAFSQRTEDVVGFQDGLGVGDAQNRSDGVVLSSHPFSNRDKLLISAVYVNGAGPEQTGSSGSGVVGDTTHTRGSAADILADSNLLDHRLRLYGEYASSDFDFDGDGIDLNHDGIIDINQDAKRDHAYSAMVSYTPWHNKLVRGKPLVWDIGLENKQIGSYFRSPTNPGGVADQQSIHGYTDLSWSGLYFYAALGTTTDNVNDDPARARIKSTDSTLTTTYTPTVAMQAGEGGKPPVTPWYGQPSYTLALTKVDQTVENAGGGFSVGGFNVTTSVSLTAGFSYPTWNWVVSHIVSKNDNKTGQAVDSRNVITQFALTKNVNQLLNFSTNLQYGTIEESNPPVNVTAKNTDTWTAGLSLSYLISQHMNALLQLNYNDAQTSDHSLDSTSRDLIASLSWAVRQAHGLIPGITLWLQGQRHDITSTSSTITNQDSYQVFVKLSMGWTPRI